MMQVQKTLGELTSTVRHLSDASEKNATKLDRISHQIYAAGVVLAIILAAGGFMLNKVWDGVFELVKHASNV